ncbi:hypothetical protein pb186bvf_015761 [Paramecium bursaria]
MQIINMFIPFRYKVAQIQSVFINKKIISQHMFTNRGKKITIIMIFYKQINKKEILLHFSPKEENRLDKINHRIKEFQKIQSQWSPLKIIELFIFKIYQTSYIFKRIDILVNFKIMSSHLNYFPSYNE